MADDIGETTSILTWVTMVEARAFLVKRTGIPPAIAEGLILRWLHLERLRWKCTEAIEVNADPQARKMSEQAELSGRCQHILDNLWQDGKHMHFKWQDPSTAMVCVDDATRLVVTGLLVAQEDMEKLALGTADSRQAELKFVLPPPEQSDDSVHLPKPRGSAQKVMELLLRRRFPPHGIPPDKETVADIKTYLTETEVWNEGCRLVEKKANRPDWKMVWRWMAKLGWRGRQLPKRKRPSKVQRGRAKVRRASTRRL